ncbi:MAG: phosphatase PAP2 family protein [Sphingomonadales bacterium]
MTVEAGMEDSDKGGALQRLLLGLQDMRSWILLVLVYVVVVWLTSEAFGLHELFRILLYPAGSVIAALFSLILIFIGYVIYLPLVARESRPIARIAGLFKTYILDPRQLANLLVPLLLLPFFMSAFTSFKSMIPEIVPFYLDNAFMIADKALHLGWHPWELTHGLFGGETASVVINAFYHMWFFFMWGGMVWHLINLGNRAHRLQFLLAFTLAWMLLGSLAALALSSAGPVYFGEVTGLADPFRVLMERLYEIDAAVMAQTGSGGLPALGVQELLWGFYTSGDTTYGSGISAMPSLHVAIMALIAMSSYRIHPLFGQVMWLMTAMILLGSVHLGWHYALDGYVSIGLAVLIWRLSGWITAREFGEP